MSDEVKPALTAEEWAHPYTGIVDTRQDLRYRIGRGDGESHPAMRHQAAAIALHGQPFGFTREDLAAIYMALESHELSRYTMQYEADVLESLAARIEALLPPEEPQ